MTLEEFENSLVEDRRSEKVPGALHGDEGRRRHHKHHDQHENGANRHRHKRRRHSRDDLDRGSDGRKKKQVPSREGKEKNDCPTSISAKGVSHGLSSNKQLHRDSWMEEKSAPDVNYIQHGSRSPIKLTTSRSSKADFQPKIHEMELNPHHLQDMPKGLEVPIEIGQEPSENEVDYCFGDAGAQWRMTKLMGVYRRAEETGRSVDDVAVDQYGDLQGFDDAREEQTELDRRDTYGNSYIGKEKPSGELFKDRQLNSGLQTDHTPSNDGGNETRELPQMLDTRELDTNTVPMDQTALNRLKAQMLKAKVRGSSNATSLETAYDSAMASITNHKQPDVILLSTMENRMLAGSRQGEVTSIDNIRGRERGLVRENEDMSIEDMVKQERRNRHQAGGDGQRFAESIAKDAKFDNNLDYMDENANKLAKRVQKSEINLKNIAVSEFQKMNRILDTCPLCHHEDTDTPPVAPIVSLATRAYLTLPTEPEISDGGACIIPVQHRGNLLECDDDEWEEIRNFMKSLIRMYHDQGRDVIFYENAAAPRRKKHAGMEVVPLPYSLGGTAPAFFKEAILTADEEWTQHKKIIDTLSKAKQGLGKLAFRRTLAKEMPYFHVWFEIDGGLGHIVEDSNRWPKGDLFAREIIGGMLDKGIDVIKRQGRWSKGGDRRVEVFRKGWRKFDWTRVLTDV